MRKDLITSLLAIVVLTVLLGLAYPLATTGVAQVVFPGASDGSRIERGGKTVGSRLIGQDFKGRPGYFQSRPSSTEYSASYTYFGNLGPNNQRAGGPDPQEPGRLPAPGGPLPPRAHPRRRARGRRPDLGVRGRSPHLAGQRPDPGRPGGRPARPVAGARPAS